jgi:hypothetical protein
MGVNFNIKVKSIAKLCTYKYIPILCIFKKTDGASVDVGKPVELVVALSELNTFEFVVEISRHDTRFAIANRVGCTLIGYRQNGCDDCSGTGAEKLFGIKQLIVAYVPLLGN